MGQLCTKKSFATASDESAAPPQTPNSPVTANADSKDVGANAVDANAVDANAVDANPKDADANPKDAQSLGAAAPASEEKSQTV